MRTSLGLVIGIIGIIPMVMACGGSSQPAPSEDMVLSVEQPETACPATLMGTSGHACSSEGMICTLPVMCETAYQQAKCTCRNGIFACADSVGALAKGEPARCVNGPSEDTSSCPTTFAAGQGSGCKEIGRSCAYPGATCANLPVQLTDYCQCKRDPADGTMTYTCARTPCPPQ